MIRLFSQNGPQFRQSLLHWNQISFPGAFFPGQQRVNSLWGPDLENMVVEEAIRNLIEGSDAITAEKRGLVETGGDTQR